ncbi:MAG: patatin-like phospholipase family protein, partial [Pseudomonadota bacterium]
QQKIDFFRRSSTCFGRSALMLSGAGSLGPFHIGVVKALAEQDLLPTIISGSSAGSLVAAVVGTHHREDLLKMLSDETLVSLTTQEGGTPTGSQMKKSDLVELVERLIPDLTFEEAQQKTGHYINVSVAPTAINQRSRLLNAMTSPNACIREAVLASCAIPGIFPPVTLAAKNASGERKAYIATRKWVDGSVSDDLPAQRLMRLYGVNHFISSQANPAVLWMLRDPDQTNVLAQIAGVYQAAARDLSKAIYPFAMNLVRNIYPMNILTRTWFGLITQEYTADINVLPRQRFFNPAKLIAKLSAEETMQLVDEGERATWPKIEMIRNCTAVSRTIDQALYRLESQGQ